MANRSFLTLFLALAVLYIALAAVPSANALQGVDLAPPMVRRAEHAELNQRMIRKKRAAEDQGVANPVGQPSTSAAATPSAPAAGSSTQPTGNGVTSTPGGVTQPTPVGPTSASSSAITSASSASSTSLSTSSVSSTSTPATSTQPTTSAAPTTRPTTSNASRSTAFVTVSSGASAQSTDDASKDQGASNLPKPVIIGLIVAGSCIAVGAIIWTVIRKWKFSPSRHFEDRLEPINWEPTNDSGVQHDPTIAALSRGASQNNGRSSLGSSDEHSGGRNMASVNNNSISMTPDFPPAHDFTAGSATYGMGAGYVDMHRGPSPGPGAYGGQAHYETPNPYDAYDYNNNNAAYGQRRY